MWSYGLGFVMDLAIGDPKEWYHPVRAIGTLIKTLEGVLYRAKASKFLKGLLGFVLMFTVVGLGFLVPYLVLKLAFKVHVILGIAVETWLIFRAFATRQLDKETKLVYKALKAGDMIQARKYMSYLVSRDTQEMSQEDIIKACIETIAENIGDGVIAPMFYGVIGGAPLAWAYKSANTLDSMVGYKNEKYEDFGYASAKFDDVLNYIPARLTSVLILLAGLVLRLDVKAGTKILMRDRHNHASPNSAYPESAAAGLLGVQLGGKATYFGKTENKPTMGDPLRPLELKVLRTTSHLLYATAALGWIILGVCAYGWRIM